MGIQVSCSIRRPLRNEKLDVEELCLLVFDKSSKDLAGDHCRDQQSEVDRHRHHTFQQDLYAAQLDQRGTDGSGARAHPLPTEPRSRLQLRGRQ